MKQIVGVAALVGALLGLGLGTSVQAATGLKTQANATKKSAKASAPTKQAARSAKTRAAKTEPKLAAKSVKPAPKVAAKPVPKAAAKTAQRGKRVVAAKAPPKPVRRVVQLEVDPGYLALHSASALVIDQETGQPLFEKRADTVTPIASITKLMTAMVVLDANLDLNEVISINEEDASLLKGTRSRLPVGTTMTRETAMLLALMSSENRAANALGRNYPGGMPAFVSAMNRKAQTLGMFRSRFEEPTGLSSNNVSTAGDLARMVAESARYPEIRVFSTTAEARVDFNGQIREFRNTNALVRDDNWEIGVSKTGYISEAGRCLVMQARVADKPVVIVLLDSQGKMTRVGDAVRIRRWMESASLTSERRPV